MLVEQLVTTVADGTVGVQGLSPNLDEDLMYRLMNLAPSVSDLEDHYLPAYLYCGCSGDRAIFSRTYVVNEETAQTNFIICQSDHLIRFQYNPALFAFISNASGLLHNKNHDLPRLPVIDGEDIASRFEPVFECEQVAALGDMALREIRENGSVAVVGIKHPFRFLIPLLAMATEEERTAWTYSVNSSYQPKDGHITLFLFPSVSSSLLQSMEEAGVATLGLSDVQRAAAELRC